MEPGDSLEGAGKAILRRMHQHYISESLDDAEYIPFAKAVMQGIADRLAADRCSKEVIEAVREVLKRFCKELYVKEWTKNREKGETVAAAEEKGNNYFEYLFKHGEHP